MRDVCIVGMRETAVGRLEGSTSLGLQAEASRLALADAGLATSVDERGVQPRSLHAGHEHVRPEPARYMGLAPTLAATIDAGGTVTPMHHDPERDRGHRAGLRGGGALHLRRERAHRPAQGARAAAEPLARPEEFEEPFGCIGMVIPYALAAQRHMHHHGTTKAARRGRGVSPPSRRPQPACPDAKPLTMADYLAARPITDPLQPARLLGDVGRRRRAGAHHRGARARSPPPRRCACSASRQATHKNVNQMPDLDALGLHPAGEMALGRAGITIADADFCCIHDAFTDLDHPGRRSPRPLRRRRGRANAAAGRSTWAPVPGESPWRAPLHAHIGGIITSARRSARPHHAAEPRAPGAARVGVVSSIGGVFSRCGVDGPRPSMLESDGGGERIRQPLPRPTAATAPFWEGCAPACCGCPGAARAASPTSSRSLCPACLGERRSPARPRRA